MNDATPCLKIVFPDFFDLIAEHEPATFESTFPYLAKLINRGHIVENPRQTIVHEILEAFGWDNSDGRLPNITALTAPLDNLQYSKSLYRADPVHLRADGVRLRLFGGDYFALSDSEAEDLIRELNSQSPDWEFYRGRDPSRWYVRFAQPLDFEAKTPVQMFQQVIDDELPTGADAKRIHSMMNECQMLMHQSRVNEERELKGKPALNSVWVWGSGEEPLTSPNTGLEIYSDDLLSLALAKRNGISCFPLPSSAALLKGLARDLNTAVVFNRPTGSLPPEISTVERAKMGPEKSNPEKIDPEKIDLAQLEQSWCETIFKGLRHGAVKRLQIIDNYRCLQINALDAWKFWRRTSYFSDRLRVDIDPQKISADISPHDTIN